MLNINFNKHTTVLFGNKKPFTEYLPCPISNIHELQTDIVEFSPDNATPDYMLKKLYNLDVDFIKKNIKNRKLKQIFNNEYKMMPLSPTEEQAISLALIFNIDTSLQNVKDTKIKKYINKELYYLLCPKFRDAKISDYNEKLAELKAIIDSYNELTGKYTTIKEYIYDIDGSMIIEDSSLIKFLKEYQYSPKLIHEVRQKFKKTNLPFSVEVNDFIAAQKNRTLVTACSNKDIGDYLYEKYYLPTLELEDGEKFLLKFINEKYGTKVFPSYEKTNLKTNLFKILTELQDWQDASNNKAILPNSIDLNSCRKDFYDKNPACASAYIQENYIAINGAHPFYLQMSLRHEITHLNDKFADSTISLPDNVIELIEKIIPKTVHGIGRHAILRTNFDKCKYREEFLKGGMSTDSTRYAYSNRAEFVATAAEAQTDRFSPKFKKILVQLGLPEYVFNFSTNINIHVFKRALVYMAVKMEHPFEMRYDRIAKYYDEKLKVFYKD